jgi:hypothetical protein
MEAKPHTVVLVDASELPQPHTVYVATTLNENLKELLFCKTPHLIFLRVSAWH